MAREAYWRERAAELTKRDWDLAGIRARLRALREAGPSSRKPDWEALLRQRGQVLERVRRRAEEYEYLTHSCAKGSLLALMEEFGLGSWELVRAMSPFPGFGLTGGICGGVTGPLIALGLFLGSDDAEDFAATGQAILAAREFIPRFQEEVGGIMCPELQEKVIFGRYMDQRASPENFAAFEEAAGFAKCALLPGIGARLAAELILERQAA